jgi:hypothetical protein
MEIGYVFGKSTLKCRLLSERKAILEQRQGYAPRFRLINPVNQTTANCRCHFVVGHYSARVIGPDEAIECLEKGRFRIVQRTNDVYSPFWIVCKVRCCSMGIKARLNALSAFCLPSPEPFISCRCLPASANSPASAARTAFAALI